MTKEETLEAELRAARDLLSIAPAFFGFLSADGVVTGCNELALAVIESTPEQIVGMKFWEAPWWKGLPASEARVREAVLAAVEGRASSFDVEYNSVAGGVSAPRWVDLRITPFRDATGKVTRIAATGTDITDRHLAQQALARAVKVSKVGFYEWDIRADHVVYSDQMKLDWGIEHDGPIAAAIERIHPDDRAQVEARIEAAMNNREPYVAEFRIVRGDKTSWVEAQGEVRYDDGGKPILFFGTSRDISQRKRIESDLRAEKHKFEAIFVDSSSAMALLQGPEFVFEQVNSKYRELVGGREVTGKSLHEALPELIGQPFHDLMKRVYATGEPFIGREMIARLVRHAGREPEDVYFDFTYSRVTDGEGRPYGVYIHAIDISERVLARRALEGAVHTLEQERDARERFVSTLTHDLRTPLTSAKLSAQMLARRPDDAGSVQRQASRIVNHVDRIDEMIRDLLDANRIKAGERLPIEIVSTDLSRIASETLAELGTIHGDRFVLRAPPELAGHWGAKEVRRILENLCNNAVKYGSSLHPVDVAIETRGDNVAIRVHNQGPSIPAAEWPSLFEPFRRADAANTGGQKGWGLGLTLVRGLAEAHGGSARLESSSESGTTFEVLLPRDARP